MAKPHDLSVEWEKLIDNHIEGYSNWNALLPENLIPKHKRNFCKLGKGIAQWANDHRQLVRVCPLPLGDPHAPFGTRALELRIGQTRRRYIWKVGEDRFAIESAVQKIVALLGSESGLAPVYGFPMADGGAWVKVQYRVACPFKRDFRKRIGRKFRVFRVNRLADVDRLARAFACLLILTGCCSLSDMHYENLAWDGDAIRVIDSETFAGRLVNRSKKVQNQDRAFRASERIICSGLLSTVSEAYGGDRMADEIGKQLEWAFAKIQDKWETILAIRKEISGKKARVVYKNTGEYFNYLPYALKLDMSSSARSRFVRNTTGEFDKNMAFDDLVNGCIPRHEIEIPAHDDPFDGVIQPSENMLHVIRAMLLPGHIVYSKMEISNLNLIAELIRFENLSDGESQVHFATLGINGIGQNTTWDNPTFLHGLGGLMLLHAGEKWLNRPHRVDYSFEVFEALPNKIKCYPPGSGILSGSTGEYLLGWGLMRLKSLSCEFVKILDDRIQYIELNNGKAFDLSDGLAGNLLSIARASEFLPSRRADLCLRAKKLVSRIIEEFTEYLQTENGLHNMVLDFAHGLAGAIFAVQQSEQLFGISIPLLPKMIEILETAVVNEQRNLLDSTAFCRNRAGIQAVIDYLDGNLGWSKSQMDPSLYAHRNSCCGAGAYHLGRITALTNYDSGNICFGTIPFGYFGVAGMHYIELTQFGSLSDPLWGRRILNAAVNVK